MQSYKYLDVFFIWSLGVNAILTPRYTTDWASIQCPENSTSALPTPTYGNASAVFTVCAENLISAPAELIYNTLIDFDSYHLWNTFVVDVEVPSNVSTTPEDVYVGMPMTFTTTGLIPLFNNTSDEIVTVLEDDFGAEYLLPAWVAAWDGLVVSEHPNILVSQGGGVTRYVSYETYYQAPLAIPLIALRSSLQKQFEQQGEDLRNYVESLVL